MAENMSVGAISLDLVIKEKLTEQLDKIKAKVSAPAAKIGEAMQAAVEKPMSKIGESVGKSVSKAFDEASDSLSDSIQAAIEAQQKRSAEMIKQVEEAAKIPPQAVKMGNYIDYDPGKIEAEITSIGDKINEKVKQTAEKAKAALSEMKKETTDTPEMLPETDTASEKLSIIQKKWQELSDVAARASSNLRSSASKSFSAIKKAGGTAFKSLKNAGGKALNSLKSHIGGIGKSASAVTKPVSKLGRTLKNTFRRVFLVAGIYAAFRAIKDGILETAKADEQFSASLKSVKQNLAIAFAPIMQAIMPALNAMMSGLASLTKQIAAFTAGLFGKTYKEAAETTKKLKNVTAAAKQAKLATAGIDEMNILSGDDSTGSSGFELPEDLSEPELPNWAEQLKESMKSGDWYSIGALFAEGINKALSSIDWDTVSSKINTGITKITDGINGFLDNIDWGTLGDTFAGGLNTITSAVNTFYDKVNWGKLGSGIAEGLNRTIKKTNWKQLGKALGARLQALIETAFSFVTKFDWSGFGKSIGDTVNGWFESIDFAKAGKTLSEGLKGALTTMISAVEQVDWVQVGNKIADFLTSIDYAGIAKKCFILLREALAAALVLLGTLIVRFAEKGAEIAEGLLKGIGDGFKNIYKWIKDNIFTPFINGFKKIFGIASPSKVMAEMGGYIVDGLFNAISEGISRIVEIFTEMLKAIKGVFTGIGEWFGSIFSGAWDNIKGAFSTVGEFFSGVWTTISNAFLGIGGWFKTKFERAWDNVKGVFSAVGEFFGNVYDDIVGAFTSLPGKMKEIFEEVWDNIKGIADKISDKLDEWTDKIPGVKQVKNSKILSSGLGIFRGLFATGGTLSRNGESAIVGEAGPEFLQLLNGRAVVTPLSAAPKLSMIGSGRTSESSAGTASKVMQPANNTEIIELLRLIVELLRSGMSVEIINYLFRDSREFSREVLKIVGEDAARRGK